jgi:hypothetical protein
VRRRSDYEKGGPLLLPATLAERLGIEHAADALIDLGERAGASGPAASC